MNAEFAAVMVLLDIVALFLMVVVLFGPILWYSAVYGIPLPFDYSEMGFLIAKRLFHVYSLGLIITTIVIVAIIVLIVSYIPSRRIAKMKPTDALKGKVTV